MRQTLTIFFVCYLKLKWMKNESVQFIQLSIWMCLNRHELSFHQFNLFFLMFTFHLKPLKKLRYFVKNQIKIENKNKLYYRGFRPTLITLRWFLFFPSTQSFFISQILVDQFRSNQRQSYLWHKSTTMIWLL